MIPMYPDGDTCACCDQYLDQSKRYAELRDQAKALEIGLVEQDDLHEQIASLRKQLNAERLAHLGEIGNLEARVRSMHMSAKDSAYGAVLAIERLQWWEPIVKAAEESIAYTPILMTPELHRAVRVWLDYKRSRS